MTGGQSVLHDCKKIADWLIGGKMRIKTMTIIELYNYVCDTTKNVATLVNISGAGPCHTHSIYAHVYHFWTLYYVCEGVVS